MEGDSINSPWKALTTITTFDRGGGTRSTARLQDAGSAQRERQVSNYNLSASLCIESLLQQVCAMAGGDADQKQRIYTVVCNQLRKLKVIDDSYNMMEFESMRIQYHNALCQLIKVTYAKIVNEKPHHLPSIVVPEWSRYRREFREVCFIAGGGFGCVYKAVHCLDGVEYAIKKISVKSHRVQCIERHLQEVKTLARLNHTNIVPYKSAWIEYALPAALNVNILPEDAAGSSRMIQSSRNITIESEGSEIVFENPSCDAGVRERRLKDVNGNSRKRGSQFETNRESDLMSVARDGDGSEESKGGSSESNAVGGIFSKSSSRSGTDSESIEENNMQLCPFVPRQPKGAYATLYIQMSLCEKTLEEWLKERVEPLPQELVVDIFTQIVQGLDYIHQRQIVHHDIKPHNIFVSTTGNLQIQLGDFGLACPLQAESHADAFGTELYAAPEQLDRKCDPKSDIYSAGIVLLELLVRTVTYMEQCELVKQLKAGAVPDTVKENYPRWAEILPKLVQKEPSKRPSSSELLNMLNEDKDAMIQELRQKTVSMQDTITRLENQLLLLRSAEVSCRENTGS